MIYVTIRQLESVSMVHDSALFHRNLDSGSLLRVRAVRRLCHVSHWRKQRSRVQKSGHLRAYTCTALDLQSA